MQVLAAGNDALRAPREVGGTNDVTVSNRVNLVDPVKIGTGGDENQVSYFIWQVQR